MKTIRKGGVNAAVVRMGFAIDTARWSAGDEESSGAECEIVVKFADDMPGTLEERAKRTGDECRRFGEAIGARMTFLLRGLLFDEIAGAAEAMKGFREGVYDAVDGFLDSLEMVANAERFEQKRFMDDSEES